MHPDEKLVYEQYCNGSLSREIDEATRTHGYGILSTGERLGAFGLKYVYYVGCQTVAVHTLLQLNILQALLLVEKCI